MSWQVVTLILGLASLAVTLIIGIVFLRAFQKQERDFEERHRQIQERIDAVNKSTSRRL